MTASIVNKRRHHPSMDRSDATIPTFTTVTRQQVDRAREIVAAKAKSDADRIVLMAMLGVTA